MEPDLMKRMHALLNKFNELESRVTELQDKTTRVLRDFEAAVGPQTLPMSSCDEREIAIMKETIREATTTDSIEQAPISAI